MAPGGEPTGRNADLGDPTGRPRLGAATEARASIDAMDEAAALTLGAELAAEGCQLPILSRRRPHDVASMHTHPFPASAAVLAGALTVRFASGEIVAYAPGDRFCMPQDAPHEETAGANGALLLIGQRFD